MAVELIILPAKSVGEMTVVSLTPPVLATTGLRVITIPTSPTLVVEPVLSGIVTSLTSIVSGVLVSMKTPLRPPAIPRPSSASSSAISSTIMTVKPVKVSSFGTTRSPGVIEAKKILWLRWLTASTGACGGITSDFSITIGLHQGSTLSPFLLFIVMDELTRAI